MAIKVEGDLGDHRRYRYYPWDEWADGSLWRLERGKDYTIPDSSLRAIAFNYAKRHAMTVRTSRHEDGIFVQFSRPVKVLRRKKGR